MQPAAAANAAGSSTARGPRRSVIFPPMTAATVAASGPGVTPKPASSTV